MSTTYDRTIYEVLDHKDRVLFTSIYEQDAVAAANRITTKRGDQLYLQERTITCTDRRDEPLREID